MPLKREPRQHRVDCTTRRSTRPTTPGTRASTMATRTTTTRTTRTGLAPSADQDAAPTLEELVVAYMDCRRHKRNTASALAFEGDRERQLVRLHRELVDDSYRPGRSICSVVTRRSPARFGRRTSATASSTTFCTTASPTGSMHASSRIAAHASRAGARSTLRAAWRSTSAARQRTGSTTRTT